LQERCRRGGILAENQYVGAVPKICRGSAEELWMQCIIAVDAMLKSCRSSAEELEEH
jgi:hypothetical protein